MLSRSTIIAILQPQASVTYSLSLASSLPLMEIILSRVRAHLEAYGELPTVDPPETFRLKAAEEPLMSSACRRFQAA